MRKFYFTTMLMISLIIIGAVKGITYIIPEKEGINPHAAKEDYASNEAFAENTQASKTTENISTEVAPEQKSKEGSENITEQVTSEATTEQQSTETVTDETKEADIKYFDNTLFIGDSRTVGLSDYGNLGNAEVFADNGMSVYKIWNTTVTLRSGAKSKLENLLTTNKYDKVYVMLGINELGYNFEQTVEQFTQLIKDIQSMQPSALIFIEGNMHVTKIKGNSSKFFNNERINLFNQEISRLADNNKIFYLDVNEYFDDSEGNLKDEYTGDGTHVYGKYYAEWIKWILSKAVNHT